MMRDCPNTTMRERLPDLLHDRLPDALRAEVHAHLNICADCRAELALMERVRAAAAVPGLDTSRIVAALPAYRPAPRWRRATDSSMVRIAAAIVLVVGGALLLRDSSAPVTDPAVSQPVAAVPGAPPPSGATTQVAVRPAPAATPTQELAVGEMFHDLTDSELQALLDALGTLEALTPVETEVVVPAVSRGAGGAT
jgi:hypothetical protein